MSETGTDKGSEGPPPKAEDKPQPPERAEGPKVPVAQVSEGRSISTVWVVPIIALLIGGWLVYKTLSEQGPVITITFDSAEGLQADKTKIKYKDVEIGKVTQVELSDDLEKVVATAQMDKGAEKYMRTNTRFWVVRARVAAGEVSGLGTLFSGAYIGCSPSTSGKETLRFEGLDKPPVVTAGMPGRHFILESDNLSSLDVGSPVYYRGIEVGQVVGYDFNEQAEAVNIRIFVNAPYHQKVRWNTRFWNASGIDVQLDAEGVNISTQSVVSILLGGVAFDVPRYLKPVEEAPDGQLFHLYGSRQDIEERTYRVKHYYLMYFDQNVRGLTTGAPVEIRGIKIGEVLDVKLEVNIYDITARVAVLVVVEPERIHSLVEGNDGYSGVDPDLEESMERMMVAMVEQGLRAQLKTSNLLTGQLYVDLDFYSNAQPAYVTQLNGYQVLPTLPAPFEQIAQRVNNILQQVEKMPLEEIGHQLVKAIKALQRTLEAATSVAGGVNDDTLPGLKAALDEFQNVMAGIEKTLGPDSALNYNVTNVMDEMSTTIRSLRALIDYMEQNPQSLIFGKEDE